MSGDSGGASVAFVWDYVGGLTYNWHSGGGVLVIAATVERARELVRAEADPDPSGSTDTPRPGEELDAPPDLTLPLATASAERVVIFPDAGC